MHRDFQLRTILFASGFLLAANSASAVNCDQPISGAVNGFYAPSQGDDQSYEYIDCVAISQDGNFGCVLSGPSTYTDFTNLRGTVITKELGGSEFSVKLTPGYPQGTEFEESWKIWIDFNDDKDFNDAGEEVFSGVFTGPFIARINAKGKIVNYNTNLRMRISMVYGPGAGSIVYYSPYSCAITTVSGYKVQSPDNNVPWGEVEDYFIQFKN